MALLEEMTIRYVVDLSALQSGSSEAKSLISGVSGAASEATPALQGMGEAFNAEQLVSGAAEAQEELASLGTQAEETGAEIASSADKTDTFSSKLNNTGGVVGFLKDKIGGLAGGILDLGNKLGGTIFAVQGLIQGATSLATGLFAPAMQIEETTNSFEVFDGSMKKAQQEMQNLSAEAAHTPFETSSIDDAALKMQSVGINAQQVIPDIQALGDALDATGRVSGADLDQIVNNFDKIQTEGHLTTDVMNSFALQGIDAWSVLEKQTGKTHEQLADLISKGLYPAKDAMNDLTTGIEKNPLYSGQMANDTNSMTGIISTLKSNFDQFVASFASPILKSAEPIFNNISTSLASPGFKDFAGSVGTGIANVFSKIATAAKGIDFKEIGTDIKNIGDWAKTSLLPALQGAEPGFSKLGTSIGKLTQSDLPPLTNGIGKLIPGLITVAGIVAGGLGIGIDALSSSFGTWGPIVGGVAAVLTIAFLPAIINSGIQSTIAGAKLTGQFVAGIVKTGVEGWTAAGKLAVFVGQTVATGVQSVIAGAKVAGSFVANIVKSGAEAVVAGAKLTASFVANIVQTGVEAVVAGAKVVGSFVASLIVTGAQAVATGAAFVVSLIPAIGSFIASATVAAATAIPGILAGFGAWIVGAVGVAAANIAAFWPVYLVIGAVAVAIGVAILVWKNWGNITTWVSGEMGKFGNFVHNVIGAAGEKFGELGNTVHNIVGNVGAAFEGLGNTIAGVWSGIWGSIRQAINWIIGGIDGFISSIDSISVNVPGIGQVGFSIPQIPYLATGGYVPPGGVAVAGDAGPELVFGGNTGATVLSNAQSQALVNSSGGSSNSREIHVHIHMDSQEIAHYTADESAQVIVQKLFGHGPVRSMD